VTPGFCRRASGFTACGRGGLRTRFDRQCGAARWSDLGDGDFGEEAVTSAGNRFYEAGTRRGVTEGVANLVDRLVEPVVEIDEGVGQSRF
jgi:hypothetical protein